MRVAVPPGLAFFKAEKSFSHGGAALQELIIPHLISAGYVRQEKRIGVEVVLPAYELMRTAVKVDPADLGTSASPLLKGSHDGSFQRPAGCSSLDVLRHRVRRERRDSRTRAAGTKEVRLEPKDSEQSVTLFFRTAASFKRGELLELDIRDVETAEQFPPGGIKLTVGRDM